jgi:hypothetical protein
VGLVSADVIATRYRLEGPGMNFRWGAKFSAQFHSDPVVQPASYAMEGEKRPGRGVNHSPSSTAEVKERVYPYF